MVLSGVSPNIKGEFFQAFTKKCGFRYFHFEDAHTEANRRRKRPSHLVLNQDPEFATSDEMAERLTTLVKLCVGSMQDSTRRSRSLVERLLSDLARKLSEFHTFHSRISSMVEYFYLIVQVFKNYLPARAKAAPEVDFDKKLLRDVFVEMFLLKMMLKQQTPRLYDHLLMLGSSVEDLFMRDSMGLFFGSFSLSFALQFADLMILFGNSTSKYSLIWIVLKLLLVKNVLAAHEEVFLAARTSGEALAAKKNVFRFYEFTEDHVARGSVLEQTVRDYFRMEATPMAADDRFNFGAEFEGDAFSVFKFADLRSFQTLEQIYIRLKRRLSADYKMFDFVYERTDDVITFFGGVRSLPWKFERDGELARLAQKVRRREAERAREAESDDEGGSESESEAGSADEDWTLAEHSGAEQVSRSRADFEHFAEERQLARSGAGLVQSGLMTSNLLTSRLGNMETINEQNETRKSLDEPNSFDPEAIGDVFRPHQVTFAKEPSDFVLRFKLFRVRASGPLGGSAGGGARDGSLEAWFRGKCLLLEQYRARAGEFEGPQKTHEVRSKARPNRLDFRAWLGQATFRGSLQLENFFDNTFERVELGLTSPGQGHVFLDLALVLQSPDSEPYEDFAQSDAGYVFCLDRMIESPLVLRRPQVLEMNSAKKTAGIFKTMRTPLKQMSAEFKQEFHANVGELTSQVLRGRGECGAGQAAALLRHQLRRHRGLRRKARAALGHSPLFPGAGRPRVAGNLRVLPGAALCQLLSLRFGSGRPQNGRAPGGWADQWATRATFCAAACSTRTSRPRST